jgi:hypothetical protein
MKRHTELKNSLVAITYLQEGDPVQEPFKDIPAKTMSITARNTASLRKWYLADLVGGREASAKGVDPAGAWRSACGLISSSSSVDRWRAESSCAKARAMACVEQTKKQDDLHDAKQAAARVPDDPYIRANLAVVRLKRAHSGADQRVALEDFRAAIAINPRDPRLRYLFGQALTLSGKIEEGLHELHYGRLLDSEGWPQIESSYQEKSFAPCVTVPDNPIESLEGAHHSNEVSHHQQHRKNPQKEAEKKMGEKHLF